MGQLVEDWGEIDAAWAPYCVEGDDPGHSAVSSYFLIKGVTPEVDYFLWTRVRRFRYHHRLHCVFEVQRSSKKRWLDSW